MPLKENILVACHQLCAVICCPATRMTVGHWLNTFLNTLYILIVVILFSCLQIKCVDLQEMKR